jgi:hypothetical protein
MTQPACRQQTEDPVPALLDALTGLGGVAGVALGKTAGGPRFSDVRTFGRAGTVARQLSLGADIRGAAVLHPTAEGALVCREAGGVAWVLGIAWRERTARPSRTALALARELLEWLADLDREEIARAAARLAAEHRLARLGDYLLVSGSRRVAAQSAAAPGLLARAGIRLAADGTLGFGRDGQPLADALGWRVDPGPASGVLRADGAPCLAFRAVALRASCPVDLQPTRVGSVVELTGALSPCGAR